MTLILGTVANGTTPHVVISADGLSLARRGDHKFVCSATRQKLWLFRHAKAAVAHCGQNKFWDTGTLCWRGIGDDLRRASEDESFARGGGLAATLAQTLTEPVETTMRQPDSGSRFTLWIARTDVSHQAMIEELCWERSKDGRILFTRKCFGKAGKGIVAVAGEGQKVAHPFLSERIDGQYYPERLADEDVPYALEYHRRFLLAALLEQSRQGKTVFGGKFQTVVISESDCRIVELDL